MSAHTNTKKEKKTISLSFSSSVIPNNNQSYEVVLLYNGALSWELHIA